MWLTSVGASRDFVPGSHLGHHGMGSGGGGIKARGGQSHRAGPATGSRGGGRGGQLEVAGVVVSSWMHNYGGPRGRGGGHHHGGPNRGAGMLPSPRGLSANHHHPHSNGPPHYTVNPIRGRGGSSGRVGSGGRGGRGSHQAYQNRKGSNKSKNASASAAASSTSTAAASAPTADGTSATGGDSGMAPQLNGQAGNAEGDSSPKETRYAIAMRK